MIPDWFRPSIMRGGCCGRAGRSASSISTSPASTPTPDGGATPGPRRLLAALVRPRQRLRRPRPRPVSASALYARSFLRTSRRDALAADAVLLLHRPQAGAAMKRVLLTGARAAAALELARLSAPPAARRRRREPALASVALVAGRRPQLRHSLAQPRSRRLHRRPHPHHPPRAHRPAGSDV